MRKIPLIKKLNPLWWFGNEDDGWCGEKDIGMNWWYARECDCKCSIKCAIKWFLRNPFHNFVFYVIGFADRKVRTEGEYSFFAPEGWYFTWRVPEGYVIKFPWLSYKGKVWEFYIGWRERGNFGLAFRK